VVHLSKSDLKRLKEAYQTTVDAGGKQFSIVLPSESGNPETYEFLVAYAKYLIEYIENNL
jgi:hypothetical protein